MFMSIKMYHYYLPLQQLLTHIYGDSTVGVGGNEPNHLSTLHHTPERQKRMHTHINFKFIVSYRSHNEIPSSLQLKNLQAMTMKNVSLILLRQLYG